MSGRHDILIIQEVFSQECVSRLSEVNCSDKQIFMLHWKDTDNAQKKNNCQGTLVLQIKAK